MNIYYTWRTNNRKRGPLQGLKTHEPISKFHFYSVFDLISIVDIGLVTKATLNSLVESGDVSAHKEKTFYEGAKAFFLVAFEEQRRTHASR